MAYQIGQPGVSAFLESLLRDLDVVLNMGDDLFLAVNTELKEVKKLLLGFEDVLLDGEKRRQLGNKGAERWMDDLKDLLYDIEGLLHEVKMEKQQLDQEITGRPSSNKVPYSFPASFHTSENVKYGLGQILIMLSKLTEEANRLELKRDAVQSDATWLEYHAKFRPKQGCYADEPIHGRKREKIEIIKRLLKEDGGKTKRKTKYEVICVVGMGGLGKTTLSQLVFQDERVKRFFDVTSWVCVSDVVNVTKLIQDLIESASERGYPNMPSALPALQKSLENIIKDKKFLLVLDDVWTTKEWKQLIGPLNFGSNGSKILVTTRLSRVAEDLGNGEPYRLGPLEHVQCLKLFNDNAFGNEDGIDNDEDLMKMGEDIVRKCEGVPLVAKLIGSLLTGKDEGEWKAVKENDLWGLAYEEEDVHPGLRLSYFYLPPLLKRCFEFFALFPSDFEFNQGELVQMWIAEGLIEAKEGKEPEEIGYQYYNDLKGRSLIQENGRMHDMVHHLASIVSGSFFFCGSSSFISSTSSLQSVRHAYIKEKLELLIDFRKLRTMIYKGDLCEELFSNKWWRNLQVSASTQYCSPDLPSSPGCDMKHLRYMRLAGKFLNSTLPDSICTLTNLRVLDLSFCRDLKILPQDVRKLSNLQFLRLNGMGIIGLSDSVCSLSNLQVLDLSCCESLTTLPNDVGNLSYLRFLKLDRSGIIGLPDSVCGLSNLRFLDLSCCQSLTTLPNDVGKLSYLEFLKLDRTGIIGLPDSVCCLPNLRVLDLDGCRSLATLPPDMGNLSSLHELKLNGTSISSFPESIVNATNLRVLQIFHRYVTLPANIGKLTKLEQLSYYRVGKGKGRGIDELKGMDRLKGRLIIENMENIESREEASTANLSSKKHIEKLEFVWKDLDAALTGRDGEMEVRVMEALVPNAAIQALSFTNYVGHKFPSWMSTAPLHNLTYLSFANLPATSEMIGMDFKSLQFLKLDNCSALREVQMMTPQLETLIVVRCKELKPEKLVLSLLWDALKSLGSDYCHVDYFVQQLKSTNTSPSTKLKNLTVSVGGDNGITSLPVGWLRTFTSLEDLRLKDLPPTNFQIVSEDDENCSVAPSEFLVSIRQLTICCCPGLVSLESLHLPPHLEVLSILDCPNLRNLPYGLLVTTLKTIYFHNCPVLEVHPYNALPFTIKYKSIVNCPKLKSNWLWKKE